jgi:hypothetical protein
MKIEETSRMRRVASTSAADCAIPVPAYARTDRTWNEP